MRAHTILTILIIALTCFLLTLAQAQHPGVGYPHNYPGEPEGDYSPAWQNYFRVTGPLPNVTWPLSGNWAGNIAVDRPGHPNDTLFFWAFEKTNGSLTEEGYNSPWGIWLNGGPGSSSMVGLLFENGPLHVASNYSLYDNIYGWNELADYFWIDQPVGVGFSTVDDTGYAENEDQVAEDFFGFLTNLVKVFPGLKNRPLYLTGESYAGTYIPYITKMYFGMENPPVNLAKIAIGDGAIGSVWEFAALPVVTIIETYPQLVGYDTVAFEYFKEQSHLCGFDLELTYPQNGYFPTLTPQKPAFSGTEHGIKRTFANKLLDTDVLLKRFTETESRDSQANGTIDPWYGCDLFDEVIDYALNFSIPWKGNDDSGFDIYYIPDALDPEAPMDASVFLNDDQTRTALHAPTSKNWVETIHYPFDNSSLGIDTSTRPIYFFSELATNASKHGVGVVIYSGNDDALISHLSSEVVIQNTTFGGIQGFTRKPSTPWYDDQGNFAGIVHQERNWTYVLVKGAGHMVPEQQPERAFILLREFILGNNTTGLVTTTANGTVYVVGGEDEDFTGVLTGQAGIFYGSQTTAGTYTYPSSTIAVWQSFIATATTSASAGNSSPNSASETE